MAGSTTSRPLAYSMHVSQRWPSGHPFHGRNAPFFGCALTTTSSRLGSVGRDVAPRRAPRIEVPRDRLWFPELSPEC